MHSWHNYNDKGQTRNAFMQMLMNNEFDEFITVYNIISSLDNDYKSLFYNIISKDEMNIIKMLFNLDIQIFNVDKDKMIIKNKPKDNDKSNDTPTHNDKANHKHSLFSDEEEEPFNVDSLTHDNKFNHYRNIWNDDLLYYHVLMNYEALNTNNIKKQLTSSSDDYTSEDYTSEDDMINEDISNTNNNNNNNIKKQLTSSSEEYYDEEEEEDISNIKDTNNNKLTSSEEYYDEEEEEDYTSDEEEEEDYTSDEEGLTSLMRSMLSSYTNT